MERVFVETASFRRSWINQGLGDDELCDLQMAILENPKAGAVIEGTGGLRKMRWSKPPKGKSGSVRIIYIDYEQYSVTYLIYVYSKGEKADITDEERIRFRKIIEEIRVGLEKKVGRTKKQ